MRYRSMSVKVKFINQIQQQKPQRFTEIVNIYLQHPKLLIRDQVPDSQKAYTCHRGQDLT